MPKRDEFDDPEGFFSRLVTLPSGEGRFPSILENRSLVISGIVFIAVVALSGVIWASYPAQNPLAGDDGQVPIIRADAKAYKYVPADRGGMAIAHADSTIFDAMRGEGAKVENLLAEEGEAPIDRQELFAGLKTDLAAVASDAGGGDGIVQMARMGDYTQTRPMTESERRADAARRNREMLEQEADPLPGEIGQGKRTSSTILNAGEVEPDLVPKSLPGQPSEMPPEDQAAEEAEAEAGTKASAARLAQEEADAKKAAAAKIEADKRAAKAKENTEKAKVKAKEPATSPKVATVPAPSVASTPASGGTSYVQVASVPDAGRVASEWQVVSSKLPMLAGKAYRTQAADLGAKGTFHRIQVGPMSKDAAIALCNQIKAQKPGGCLVVK